jgi:hypothetical protein
MEVRLLVHEDELSQARDQLHDLVIQRKEEYDVLTLVYTVPLHRVFPAHYGERRTISEGYWNFYSLCSHYKISLLRK